MCGAIASHFNKAHVDARTHTHTQLPCARAPPMLAATSRMRGLSPSGAASRRKCTAKRGHANRQGGYEWPASNEASTIAKHDVMLPSSQTGRDRAGSTFACWGGAYASQPKAVVSAEYGAPFSSSCRNPRARLRHQARPSPTCSQAVPLRRKRCCNAVVLQAAKQPICLLLHLCALLCSVTFTTRSDVNGQWLARVALPRLS